MTTTTKTNRLAKIAFLLCLSIMGLVIAGNSQTVKMDASGNYVAVKDTTLNYKATGKTYTTEKGETFPVYLSKTGKLFVIRTSKTTGKEYRSYLKID